MEGTMLQPLGIVALVVAMIVTLYEMGVSLRPATCPECPHCRQRAEEAARLQERLSQEYARRNGLDIDDDEDGRID
jgi:hypothetical protein